MDGFSSCFERGQVAPRDTSVPLQTTPTEPVSTARKAEQTIQSLLSKPPDSVLENASGSYRVIKAGLYKGRGADSVDGTNSKCVIGLSPASEEDSEESSISPWVLGSFEKDAGSLGWDENVLKGPVTTAVQVIRALDIELDTENMVHNITTAFGFTKDGVHVEGGRPGLNGPSTPWGLVMTRSDESPSWRKKEPFDASQYSRLLDGYIRRIPYADRKELKTFNPETSTLNKIVGSEDTHPELSYHPERVGIYDSIFRPSQESRTEQDEYHLFFPKIEELRDSQHPILNSLNDRDTFKEAEDKFSRNLDTFKVPFAILLDGADEGSEPFLHYTTKDGYSVLLQQNEEEDSWWHATLTDLKSG